MKEDFEEKTVKKKFTIYLKINDNVYWIFWWLIVVAGLVTCEAMK